MKNPFSGFWIRLVLAVLLLQPLSWSLAPAVQAETIARISVPEALFEGSNPVIRLSENQQLANPETIFNLSWAITDLTLAAVLIGRGIAVNQAGIGILAALLMLVVAPAVGASLIVPLSFLAPDASSRQILSTITMFASLFGIFALSYALIPDRSPQPALQIKVFSF